MSPPELPLFPLANVVLFPKVQTPLHLFEPRYRQLAEHAVADGSPIGMCAVPPEHAGAMAGDPPLYPVGCAGEIAQRERLADGRWSVVLLGTRRFRIVSELPRRAGRLYRVARVEWLDDPFPEAERERVARLRERIVGEVGALVRRSDPESGSGIRPDLFAGIEDAVFVNSLANALALGPPERQGLLEAGSVPERFERLEGLLSFRLAELDAGLTPGSGRLH